MKIIHIGNLKSGIDTYVRSTIASVDDRFDFVIVCGADDNSQPYLKGNRVIRQYRIEMYRALNPVKDMMALIQAIKIIRKERPDLIHCHSAKGGVIGRLAAFLTGTKVLYTPHAFSFLSAESKAKRKIFLMLERFAKLNSKLLACADSERALAISTVGYKDEESFVWNNAILDIQSSEVCVPPNDIKDEKYIVSVGRPSFQKDPLLMVEVMKRVHEKHPEVKFYMVGVGFYSPLLEEMSNLIRQYDLQDTMILVPWLDRRETLGYVHNSLFYLTTSRYEGLPIAVLEALALSKAIVSTDVLGNQDCVEPGINGELHAPDPDAIADSCCRLLEDDCLRENMGVASRRLFEEKFLINNRIGDLEDLYLKQIQLGN